MRHIPHVVLEGNWSAERIRLAEPSHHHLRKVLRLGDGAAVSYTDGNGRTGMGVYAEHGVVRGEEQLVAPESPSVVLVVAPPQSTDRARFVIEKAAELGVAEVRWLRSRYSGSRIPRPAKTTAWATAALEQSRGAWLMRTGATIDLAEVAALPSELTLMAHPGGTPILEVAGANSAGSITVAVGPEGGFAEDEIPRDVIRVGLGERLLRVETAAIVAAGVLRVR